MDRLGGKDEAAERPGSPLMQRKGILPPMKVGGTSAAAIGGRNPVPSSASSGLLASAAAGVSEHPAAVLRLPSIPQADARTAERGNPGRQHLCPSPLRATPARSADATLQSNRLDVDTMPLRCPSPESGAGRGQQRRGSLSPARRGHGVIPRVECSPAEPAPLRRTGSADGGSSGDELPPIGGTPGACTNGAGGLSSSSNESLGEVSLSASSSSGLRHLKVSSGHHLPSLREFSALSRSLPSLSEEGYPSSQTSSVRSNPRLVAEPMLPRSGSFDNGFASHRGSVDGRLRSRHSLGSRSLASMASPMSSRRRVRQPASPTPLSLGDLSPDVAVGMLYSKESPSTKRRSKTVSPEPSIPEDVVAPSPTIPRRRSPSPQPAIHSSGIPVSPLATGGPAGGAGGRHGHGLACLPSLATSPRRVRPNNVNILKGSISPARASSLDSGEEQNLMSLSPVKELEADDEDPAMDGQLGRASRSRSLGSVEAGSRIGAHMPKSLTMDDLKTRRRSHRHTSQPAPRQCDGATDEDECDVIGEEEDDVLED